MMRFLMMSQGSVGTGVQALAVSHSGIRLLKTLHFSAKVQDHFRVLRSYRFMFKISFYLVII